MTYKSPPVHVARFHLAFGVLSFLLGFALIVGGPAGASAYAYSVITEHGGVYVWGTVFVALGVALIMSINRPLVMKWLLWTGCLAYWILACTFGLSAIMHAEANLTAMIAYGWISAMHWCAFRKTRSVQKDLTTPVVK